MHQLRLHISRDPPTLNSTIHTNVIKYSQIKSTFDVQVDHEFKSIPIINTSHNNGSKPKESL